MALLSKGLFSGIFPLDDIFGTKPKIPAAPKIEDAQTGAVKANVASFADIAKLATQVDAYNQDQLAALMEKQLPGGAGKIRDLISSRLAGEIPEGTMRQLRRTSAERNAGALTGGSGFKLGGELASQLGLSLDLQNQGFNSALQWMQSTKTPTFDVTSMFISPTQKYEASINQWNRDMMAAKVAAAPDPATRGLHDTLMTLTTAYLSKGGGSYGGNYFAGNEAGPMPSSGGSPQGFSSYTPPASQQPLPPSNYFGYMGRQPGGGGFGYGF